MRVTTAGLLVALVATALPFTLKPMHPNRAGHKHAGLWLASHMTDKDALLDPFCWAEWYAGRTLYRTSWNPPNSHDKYIVLENEALKGSPHSRLPTLQAAKEAAVRGHIVYHWPEDVPVEEAVVHVYKLGP